MSSQVLFNEDFKSLLVLQDHFYVQVKEIVAVRVLPANISETHDRQTVQENVTQQHSLEL